MKSLTSILILIAVTVTPFVLGGMHLPTCVPVQSAVLLHNATVTGELQVLEVPGGHLLFVAEVNGVYTVTSYFVTTEGSSVLATSIEIVTLPSGVSLNTMTARMRPDGSILMMMEIRGPHQWHSIYNELTVRLIYHPTGVLASPMSLMGVGSYPSFSMMADGSVVLVMETDPKECTVYILSDSLAVLNTFQVFEPSPQSGRRCAVAPLQRDQNTFVIGWNSGSPARMYAQAFTWEGTPLGNPTLVSDSSASNSDLEIVEYADQNGALFMWKTYEQSTRKRQLIMRHVNGSGEPMGAGTVSTELPVDYFSTCRRARVDGSISVAASVYVGSQKDPYYLRILGDYSLQTIVPLKVTPDESEANAGISCGEFEGDPTLMVWADRGSKTISVSVRCDDV